MPGGVSAYAAVSARVRVKYSRLAGASGLHALSEAQDLSAFTEILGRTSYGPAIVDLKERKPGPSAVAQALRGWQAVEARSVIRAAPGTARRILLQLHRRQEVNNLKAVLRGVAAGAGPDGGASLWERIRLLLSPDAASIRLPYERMVEAGTVAGAIELVRGTAYYEVLSFALKRYSTEQSLFALEVALDLDYWRRLWQEARKLAGEDQTQALRVISSLVDANNIMWAVRYRVYKHLSEEELINYTLPFGWRVQDEDVRAIAAGGDIGSIIGRIYPEIEDLGGFLEQDYSGLPRLEVELKRTIARRCIGAFLGNPFHVGLPLAYLVMQDLEIQDLIVLLEAKSTEVAAEEYVPFMLNMAGIPA